jgi:hypothetical protein
MARKEMLKIIVFGRTPAGEARCAG